MNFFCGRFGSGWRKARDAQEVLSHFVFESDSGTIMNVRGASSSVVD